ncbi:hypothetical protein MJO28_015736 [Puccinia striiformis f. sp. tritici]|uniref:CSD domain-containing protein n=4 Tax=Puccinia striiformis TaxID=27350 RepID=A0A0L0UUE3_9BASI|nr:hypothetical protein Pst134EA_029290 [Puccinia striiformis f. sp. tritici]KAI9623972.1 hypothetical protein KEM48_009199 [Puccinia striiformis f. sp. tritici PST-130]KNE90374.1 hypothetical protein PSTG_16199 [Puccinia striiformis f. sp. tritici PST-78]POW16615.1 hypothetical protein PSTT_01112 [Puccinia striiformis]KAH9441287.1 hypothetical protein Pst134EB_029950 [Puccinia striiformis f. sp. tritici]KAH9447256.1 hypothetical protein Pst134EA_029290 [Puccinia striiformis f. sp. tritici]
MSLALESLVPEDQMMTPTPGSPHPYLPIDNSHDRLNSIQLSSDASGEFSVSHSPRLFFGPPGEGLAELRNALNPPWLHGVTGSPSLVTNHSADRAGRWVENARRHADQHQSINFANHANLASLSLGHRIAGHKDLSMASPQLRQSAYTGKPDRVTNATLDAAFVGNKPRGSPFDQPTYMNKRGGGHGNNASANRPASMPKAHDGHSGDGSSEDEESWPMPETPFMSHEVWTEDPKSNKLQGAQPLLHDIHKVFPSHHQRKQTGVRTQNLAGKNSAKEGERRIGRCKMYNCDKGVGFLIDDRLDQVQQDVKIHWTDIFSDQEFKSLAKGEIVEYTLNITANGYSASYVTGPGGRPVMGAEQAIVQASRQTSYKLFKAGALPVKTYRSKWESLLSPGESESSPVQPANPVSNVSRSAVTPRHAPNGTDSKVAPASAPAPAGSRNQNQFGKPGRFSAEQLKGSATEPRGAEKNEGQNRSQEHHHFNDVQAQFAGGPAGQFNTPGWGTLRSPLSYLQSANSLVSNFAGAHTPLPALSHSGMTPHSADSFNPIFPSAGFNSSVRSPVVSIATPSDASQSYLANQGLPTSQRGMSQPDFQSFLAERQMLLQQQALLMSMYQNANQPIPASAINAFNQLSFMNPMGAKSALGKAGEAQSYYEGQNGGVFGLLPPIALPTSKDSHKINTSPWRASDPTGMKRDSSASLRANALSFTPAGSSSAHLVFGDGQNKVMSPQTQEVQRKGDSPVYQIPGRRSVSDPAALPGGKKLHALGHPPQTRHSSSPRQVSERAGQQKRVTFAEHSTPSRRVVSHGEQVGTPLMMRALEEEASEVGEESLELSGESTYISTQLYNPEETRRCEDFTSVDLALERLRVAAAPRRLSLIKPAAPSSSVSSKPAKSGVKSPESDAVDVVQQPPKLSLMIQETVAPAANFKIEA